MCIFFTNKISKPRHNFRPWLNKNLIHQFFSLNLKYKNI